MRLYDVMIARAERIQLAAHRGGAETPQAQRELDGAIDNQIELDALVHTFGGPDVQKKEDKGLQHAVAGGGRERRGRPVSIRAAGAGSAGWRRRDHRSEPLSASDDLGRI